MNLTLFQKGVVLVALPLFFQLAFVIAVVESQNANSEAEHWASHTQEVLAQANEIHTNLSDARAGVQGYVITSEFKFAEPYRHSLRTMPGLSDALLNLVRDNPGQMAQAQKLCDTARVVLNWLGEVEQLVRAGGSEAATLRIRSEIGYGLMEEFRREFAPFVADEERLARERQRNVERSRSRFNLVLTCGGLAAFACTMFLAYTFRRGIGDRFAILEENARLLTAGKSPISPLGGSDEMARLDRAFRAMAANLTRASDEVRDLYDNAPCGYHALGPDGKYLTVNRTELQWLGYSAEELVGQRAFQDLLSPASRELFRNSFSKFKSEGSVRDLEFEMIRRDGTTFPVLVSATAVIDAEGNYLRSRSTVTDITERKRNEAAVRLFADVAQSVPIGILIYQLDAEGDPPILRVRSCNREAERLLNVPLAHAAGNPVVEVFPAIPDEQLRRYTAVAVSGVPDDFGEFQYGDARVEERWWQVLAFPLPERSVGLSFRDVTERRRVESEVRRLNAELEDRVRERTAELELANRDLAQKNAENEMFVYSVSHDLRSPLVNLQGFSRELEKVGQQLATVLEDASVPAGIRDQVRAILSGKMAKSIGFIQTAVLRLSGIIDALLRLSRAGRVEYRRECVDVGKVVARVVEAANGTITERGSIVRVAPLPSAWGDRTAIEQVFANLIGNALTYLSPNRQGVVEVGCRPEVASGLRTYFVRDNGLGIAEGHRQKIFQAFQRAHPGVGSGEGLGLAIVARVAERHNGRAWVESKPGEGSTFFVTLPAAPEAGAR